MEERKAISLTTYKYINSIQKMRKYFRGKLIPQIFQHKYQLFATGGEDKRIYLFSNSFELMSYLHGHKESIECLECISTSKIASGSDDHTIKIWNLGNGKCFQKITTLSLHTEDITALCSLKPNIMVSGSMDHSLVAWDLEGFIQPKVLLGHSSYIVGIVTINCYNNLHIISGEYKGILMAWNIEEGICIVRLQGEAYLTQMKSLNNTLIGYAPKATAF